MKTVSELNTLGEDSNFSNVERSIKPADNTSGLSPQKTSIKDTTLSIKLASIGDHGAITIDEFIHEIESGGYRRHLNFWEKLFAFFHIGGRTALEYLVDRIINSENIADFFSVSVGQLGDKIEKLNQNTSDRNSLAEIKKEVKALDNTLNLILKKAGKKKEVFSNATLSFFKEEKKAMEGEAFYQLIDQKLTQQKSFQEISSTYKEILDDVLSLAVKEGTQNGQNEKVNLAKNFIQKFIQAGDCGLSKESFTKILSLIIREMSDKEKKDLLDYITKILQKNNNENEVLYEVFCFLLSEISTFLDKKSTVDFLSQSKEKIGTILGNLGKTSFLFRKENVDTFFENVKKIFNELVEKDKIKKNEVSEIIENIITSICQNQKSEIFEILGDLKNGKVPKNESIHFLRGIYKYCKKKINLREGKFFDIKETYVKCFNLELIIPNNKIIESGIKKLNKNKFPDRVFLEALRNISLELDHAHKGSDILYSNFDPRIQGAYQKISKFLICVDPSKINEIDDSIIKNLKLNTTYLRNLLGFKEIGSQALMTEERWNNLTKIFEKCIDSSAKEFIEIMARRANELSSKGGADKNNAEADKGKIDPKEEAENWKKIQEQWNKSSSIKEKRQVLADIKKYNIHLNSTVVFNGKNLNPECNPAKEIFKKVLERIKSGYSDIWDCISPNLYTSLDDEGESYSDYVKIYVGVTVSALFRLYLLPILEYEGRSSNDIIGGGDDEGNLIEAVFNLRSYIIQGDNH